MLRMQPICHGAPRRSSMLTTRGRPAPTGQGTHRHAVGRTAGFSPRAFARSSQGAAGHQRCDPENPGLKHRPSRLSGFFPCCKRTQHGIGTPPTCRGPLGWGCRAGPGGRRYGSRGTRQADRGLVASRGRQQSRKRVSGPAGARGPPISSSGSGMVFAVAFRLESIYECLKRNLGTPG